MKESFSTESLQLVPQSFLEKISNAQDKIVELLSSKQTTEGSVGDFISETEAAKLLGRKTTWFWNLRKQGVLPYTKVGNKVFYSKKDIQYLFEKNKKGRSL